MTVHELIRRLETITNQNLQISSVRVVDKYWSTNSYTLRKMVKPSKTEDIEIYYKEKVVEEEI